MVLGMVGREEVESVTRVFEEEGLGAFPSGHRTELAARHLHCEHLCPWDGGCDRSRTGLSSGPREVLEIFLLRLMVPEFSLLGEISRGFYRFFVSNPIFAFRFS